MKNTQNNKELTWTDIQKRAHVFLAEKTETVLQVYVDGKTLFGARETARNLGYDLNDIAISDTMAKIIPEKERAIISMKVYEEGEEKPIIYRVPLVTKNGLYNLFTHSPLPEAKKLVSEILEDCGYYA